MRIRVVDLETTGFDPVEDRICEIGWCDVVEQDHDLLDQPCTWKVDSVPQSLLIFPGRPIPPVTSAVHHIIDADVKHAPAWDEAAPEILNPAGASDRLVALAAHNAKFERSFISETITGPIAWICTYKCALRLWSDAPSHSNHALRYLRNPVGLERQVASIAHRAGPDAYVTAFHLRDMLDIVSIEQLVKWSSEPALLMTCHIGKFRGVKWADVDRGFMRWLLDRDFDEDVHYTCRHWLASKESRLTEMRPGHAN